jgi:hypothetical protein
MIMDDLENESLSFEKMNKNLYTAKKKGRRVQDADLGAEDEDQDTIFIDSLPNDEFTIRD